MALQMISILGDNKYFTKFCSFENKIFGCQAMYGCNVACPLWRARNVEQLCNEKGMTIGEAHKASLRLVLTEEEGLDALVANIKAKPTIDMKELINAIKGDSKTRRNK